MKARLFAILALLVIVGLWVWWPYRQLKGVPDIESNNNATNETTFNHSTQGQQNRTDSQPQAVSTSQATQENNPSVWIENRRKQIEEEVQRGLNEWRTPIEFYGLVLDENTKALSGVNIEFSCNDTSSNGTSYYRATSDANGFFSLNDVQGKLLVIRLSKQGYYSSKRDNNSFEYGDRYARFIPDAGTPVIFHMRKQGAAERLIHIQAPTGGAKGFRITRDGIPLEISLTTGNTTALGQGDLLVQCWTDDHGKSPGQKYDWKCRITVPNGGIAQYDIEFPFEAPLEGYQPSSEIEMSTNLEQGWSRSARRNYFLKLANGTYARINFEMVAGGDHFFQVESFLNPSGSRNLEFDPQLAINP